ncbi:MAG: DUF721 domain-containing protein [Alphaproteobacteria bacterium]|nr:DUF721 domain-containing protein [Alphaproteobacteria bacterium]
MSEKRRFSLFPKPLSGCIEPLTRPVIRKHAGALARLLTDWPSIAGESLAAICHPHQIARGRSSQQGATLMLAVQNGHATEVQYMSAVLLERISQTLGDHSIHRITIAHTYTPPAAPAKAPPRTRAAAGRLSACAAQAALAEVEDDELRQTLTSLASAMET